MLDIAQEPRLASNFCFLKAIFFRIFHSHVVYLIKRMSHRTRLVQRKEPIRTVHEKICSYSLDKILLKESMFQQCCWLVVGNFSKNEIFHFASVGWLYQLYLQFFQLCFIVNLKIYLFTWVFCYFSFIRQFHTLALLIQEL